MIFFVHNFLLVLIDKNNVTKAKSHELIFEPTLESGIDVAL